MFTRYGKKYIIKYNGKFYLPVRKVREYWKEISENITVLPKYKAYISAGSGIVIDTFWYYNSVNGKMYTHKTLAENPLSAISFNGKTTNESELVEINESSNLDSYTLTSITETRIDGISFLSDGSSHAWSVTRSATDDFGSYTATSSTVIVGTPDDYTYYEDVLIQY